jgi:hypothetical protein
MILNPYNKGGHGGARVGSGRRGPQKHDAHVKLRAKRLRRSDPVERERLSGYMRYRYDAKNPGAAERRAERERQRPEKAAHAAGVAERRREREKRQAERTAAAECRRQEREAKVADAERRRAERAARKAAAPERQKAARADYNLRRRKEHAARTPEEKRAHNRAKTYYPGSARLRAKHDAHVVAYYNVGKALAKWVGVTARRNAREAERRAKLIADPRIPPTAGPNRRKKLKRKFAIERATPAWADHALIDEIYSLTKLLSEQTGEVWEVDHIVPLRSPLVCGLHVPANLFPMRGLANARKGNKTWPDMP